MFLKLIYNFYQLLCLHLLEDEQKKIFQKCWASKKMEATVLQRNVQITYNRMYRSGFPKLFCKWYPLKNLKKSWPLSKIPKTLLFSATREYLVLVSKLQIITPKTFFCSSSATLDYLVHQQNQSYLKLEKKDLVGS